MAIDPVPNGILSNRVYSKKNMVNYIGSSPLGEEEGSG